MKLYSTSNPSYIVNFKEALFKGLPPDNGLFMPKLIPKLPDSFYEELKTLSFQEISFHVAKNLFQNEIPENDLRKIIETAINFQAPLVKLNERQFVLELFHGPSLAFKDFGARFMAQLMSYYKQEDEKDITILVATSGDTGGAVASGFYKTKGINVVILYPSGRVSHLQEQQLTTFDENITAIEVEGNFDDCQTLVKSAFLDEELQQILNLSSANSINIARLIPQSFYYFEAFKQLDNVFDPVVFSVPSGNFGNLTAGFLAKKMGLPASKFIAATNSNDVIPRYLQAGVFTPKKSIQTISSAMDVGNPSNFSRMLDLYSSTWNKMIEDLEGFSFSDFETENTIREVHRKFNYVIDPHGAVGYLGLNLFQKKNPKTTGVVLETAHPAKFLGDVERILKVNVNIPQGLSAVNDRKGRSVKMKNNFFEFKEWLIGRY